MGLFSGLLNSTCSIYRLSGRSGFNFTLSDEGEVDETWSLISSGTACRLDRMSTPMGRDIGGLIERGTGMLFLEYGTNIEDRDRVLLGGKWYVVTDVTIVEGLVDPHHLECSVVLIDWKS